MLCKKRSARRTDDDRTALSSPLPLGERGRG
jgi:hypothetical protein